MFELFFRLVAWTEFDFFSIRFCGHLLDFTFYWIFDAVPKKPWRFDYVVLMKVQRCSYLIFCIVLFVATKFEWKLN